MHSQHQTTAPVKTTSLLLAVTHMTTVKDEQNKRMTT
jgi:hypothetical protein